MQQNYETKNYSLLTLLQLSIYEVQCAGQIRCFHNTEYVTDFLNPLNAKLNAIYHFLALLGAHHILHFTRIRVNVLGSTYCK